MPAKNRRKEYQEHSYYHLYNRGVEKRKIFLEEQDYRVFLSYLKTYLLPKNEEQLLKVLSNIQSSSKEKDTALKLLRLNNFAATLDMIAYCLMSNHFHFLVYQYEQAIIDSFMNSLCTRYSMYFNKKYKRVGPLFQGVYKGVKVTSEEQLLYLTRYIHRNPSSKGQALQKLELYPYSSYSQFLGLTKIDWVKPNTVLAYFSHAKQTVSSYKSFIESSQYNGEEVWHMKAIGDIV